MRAECQYNIIRSRRTDYCNEVGILNHVHKMRNVHYYIIFWTFRYNNTTRRFDLLAEKNYFKLHILDRPIFFIGTKIEKTRVVYENDWAVSITINITII